MDGDEFPDVESGGSAGSDVRGPFVVPAGPRVRLDAFLGACLGESRSRIKKWVEQGFCRVDGEVRTDADARLRPGAAAAMAVPCAGTGPEPEDGPLDVVWCDADVAVVNKPAGLTVHPCPSCPSGTLVNRLLRRFPQLAEQDGPRPGIVHRLDKDTSGLVVIALSERARVRLAADFAERRVRKTYLALTRGVPPAEGGSDKPVGRHPVLKTRMAVVPLEKGGRSASTSWTTLYASPAGRFALLAVRIRTGRTHQIRVHLADAGFPLQGDSVYGPSVAEGGRGARRQMLHAWRLEFTHPATGEAMRFLCPPPPDFPEAMLSLERGASRVILTGMPGCGKSSVLQRMEAAGAVTWSADREVAAQYEPGSDGWHLMRRKWGGLFMTDSGRVDRRALGELLAGTPGMRRDLERLIHPLVRYSMTDFFEKADAGGASVAVAEVPLWFETGWSRPPGALVAVIRCADGIRHGRLRSARGWSDDKISSVDSWQWPQAEKLAAADLVVPNEGTPEDLDAAVGRFFMQLAERRSGVEKQLVSEWNGLWSGPELPEMK